jgi:hypothetical protein
MERQLSFSPRWKRPALTLHVDEHGGGYQVRAQGEWWLRWQQFRLGVGREELADLNLLLQQALEALVDEVAWLPESWKSDDGPVARLVETGEYVFTRLFPDPAARRMIGESLRRGSLVEVASERFLLPWELLALPGPGRKSVANAWGMRCVVARLPFIRPGDDAPDWDGPPRGRAEIVSRRPHLGLIVSDALHSVRTVEVPSFEERHESGKIHLDRLLPLAMADRRTSLGAFRDFVGQDRDLLHLACHAAKGDLGPESNLEVSDRFPITLLDFDVQHCRIPGGAFVMLNACRTGTMNPASLFNWSSTFLQRGASGVLATEFRVLDSFAARFASRFYDLFLAGVPVGEAVLRARRHFWRTERNPLGLGYSLYSSPDIQVLAG